jgi:Holliday junction resolvase RusA-like endonuclease
MIDLLAIKLPPTSNHRLMPLCMGGRARLIKTKKFREWEKEAGDDIAGRRAKIEEGSLFVKITLRWPDRRKRDLDGPVKPLLDLIVRECFIEDDSLIERLEVVRYSPDEYDLEPGTCDIFIQTMKDYNCPF